jgi:hypothetical protein
LGGAGREGVVSRGTSQDASKTGGDDGTSKNQKKGAEHLGEQAPPFERGVVKPMNPPVLPRKMPAGPTAQLIAGELEWRAQHGQDSTMPRKLCAVRQSFSG